MKKKVIRLDFAYDGTDFKGFQRQQNARTVQEEIEKALSLFYGEPITIFCAGRTDTGVHAIHQVASFKTEKNIPPEGLKRGLNSYLPKDIRVFSVKEESEKFHARFSPFCRTYLFVIYNGEICPPFLSRYVWHIREKLNIRKLKKTLRFFVGKHDFTSFCQQPDTENMEREIYSIRVFRKKDFIFIKITGNAFLRRMIRILIGCAVGITRKKEYKPEEVKNILLKKDRTANPFITAPPNGLYFYRVDFKKPRFFFFQRLKIADFFPFFLRIFI